MVIHTPRKYKGISDVFSDSRYINTNTTRNIEMKLHILPILIGKYASNKPHRMDGSNHRTRLQGFSVSERYKIECQGYQPKTEQSYSS